MSVPRRISTLLTDEIDIAISLKYFDIAEIESRNILETRKKLVYNLKQNGPSYEKENHQSSRFC